LLLIHQEAAVVLLHLLGCLWIGCLVIILDVGVCSSGDNNATFNELLHNYLIIYRLLVPQSGITHGIDILVGKSIQLKWKRRRI
jgi:hypothetical protein